MARSAAGYDGWAGARGDLKETVKEVAGRLQRILRLPRTHGSVWRACRKLQLRLQCVPQLPHRSVVWILPFTRGRFRLAAACCQLAAAAGAAACTAVHPGRHLTPYRTLQICLARPGVRCWIPQGLLQRGSALGPQPCTHRCSCCRQLRCVLSMPCSRLLLPCVRGIAALALPLPAGRLGCWNYSWQLCGRWCSRQPLPTPANLLWGCLAVQAILAAGSSFIILRSLVWRWQRKVGVQGTVVLVLDCDGRSAVKNDQVRAYELH
jgi:hypothetical protein